VLCLSQSGRSFQVRSNRPASRSPERPKRPFPSRKEDFNAKAPRKIALVTGGSSGIGLATAKRFVEEGAFVYIAARRQTEMDKAALLIGRNVAAVRGGVSNLADLDRLYTKIASEKGRIDILFGGAGIVDPQPLGETTEESFDKLFATNTRALAFTVKKALPLLNDAGAIIVITSIAENKGILCFTAYSASKAAVRSLVRTWRAELKDRRIRVNAISPGPIDTPIFEQQAPTKEGADQARAQFAAATCFCASKPLAQRVLRRLSKGQLRRALRMQAGPFGLGSSISILIRSIVN
jgi:NAD(P)-dependent dehydrogenase (short-subunit alcohol dehydrogenase family)